jgi:hypothetical protein
MIRKKQESHSFFSAELWQWCSMVQVNFLTRAIEHSYFSCSLLFEGSGKLPMIRGMLSASWTRKSFCLEGLDPRVAQRVRLSVIDTAGGVGSSK